MKINIKLAIIIFSIIILSLLIIFMISNNAFNKAFNEKEAENYARTKQLVKNIITLQNDKLKLLAESINNDATFLHSTLIAGELGYYDRPYAILEDYISSNNVDAFIYTSDDFPQNIANTELIVSGDAAGRLCESDEAGIIIGSDDYVLRCKKINYQDKYIGRLFLGYKLYPNYENILSAALAKEVRIYKQSGFDKEVSKRDGFNYYTYLFDDFYKGVSGYIVVKEGTLSSVYSKYKPFGIALLFYCLIFIFIMFILYSATWVLISRRLQRIHLIIQNHLRKKSITLRKQNQNGDEISEIKDTIVGLFEKLDTYEFEKEKSAMLTAIGQISSHIAHDMRSPLAVLETYVKKECVSLDPDEREFKCAAARSVKKLLHMADDLVDYAKAKKVERIIVNLKKFMTDSVIMETRSKSLESNIRIRCALDENMFANIDAYKMGRVLINLANNSMQAIPHDHGEIAISATVENGETLVIEVDDNGNGIEKDHISHIFDSFYTVGKVKGIGLGLSYCKQVVEAHGGTIDVESEAGKGAKFTIRIPKCIVCDYKPVIESKTANIDYIGRRFLVVDDDEDIRRNWKRIIEDNGGQVAWEAVSSNDIIKGDSVDARSIDAAIVDYNFPDSALTGADVIKHLRSRGIKEIHLCTGFADDENIRNAALSAGATSVIGKG